MTWMKGSGRGLYRNSHMREIKEIQWYENLRKLKNNKQGKNSTQNITFSPKYHYKLAAVHVDRFDIVILK